MAVLAVLALINLGLVLYILSLLRDYERSFDYHYNEIIAETNHFINHRDMIYGKILDSLDKQTEQIKNIPKEIAVKNYLKIP